MENKIENYDKVPKISVVILTYNRAKLLARAIKSVLNQTFSDFELVIVNNSATDNTDEIVKSFDDKRIIYKKNEKNEGPLGGKNTGLDVVRSKYLIFLDDDDEFLPDALETIIDKFAELSPKGVKILWFDCIDVETGGYSGSGLRKEGYVIYEDCLCSAISGDYQMAIDRSIIGNDRFDSDLWGGILSILFLKLHRDNKAFYIPKVICKLYREHGYGRVSEPEVSFLDHITKIVLTLKTFLKEYGEEIKIACPKCYGQRLASIGFYQILNGDTQEGRSNILKSFKFYFSLAHFSIFMFSFVLDKKQIKSICLNFFKTRKMTVNLSRKFIKPTCSNC
jgi:glycosyltransferase involved in cell wall biosynthesis